MSRRRDVQPEAQIPGELTSPSERQVFWWFAGAALLCTLVFFGSFLTHGDRMLFGTDMLSQAYQNREFAVAEVEQGRGVPHWNPFVFAGLPFLSILPGPVYYPTSLLYLVAPLHRAIGFTFVLHFLLAGLLAYAMAREFGLRPGAAIVTGTAYMFGGYLVSHLYGGQDGRMFAMTLTPALFLFAERALSRRSGHWFVWMGGVVALQLFTPHVQMAYFAAMAVSAYVLFRLIRMHRETRSLRTPLRLLGWFAGAYLVAGAITLVEVWPTWQMLQFSHRADRGYAYASSWAMPVPETLALIWPAFQGYLDSYWGSNPFKLHTEYLGAVPVLLTVIALTARRTVAVKFFAGLAVVALLFAWGAATPVHRIFYWTLPVMKSFRAPAMMFSVVALSVVVLAGYGAQALYDRRTELADPRHLAWKVAGGLGILWVVLWLWAAGNPGGFARFWAGLLYPPLGPDQALAMQEALPDFVRGFGLFTVCWAVGLGVSWGAIRGFLAPLAAGALLAGVTVADLWQVDKDFYLTVEASRLAPDSAVRYLQAQPAPFRVWPLPGTYGPNDLMLHRIESVTGSQNFRLRWWDDLVGEDFARLGQPRVLRLLDVEYIVSPQALQVSGLELVFEERGRWVYRWAGDGPRAWLVHDAVVRPAGAAPAAALLSPELDLTRSVLLEPGAPVPAFGEPGTARAEVRWETRTPNRLALVVDAPAAGMLVLSEIYHPYWSATVDARAVPVRHVNVAMRGLEVPAGRHRVEMTFRDPAIALGAWGSVLGTLLFVSLLALTWPSRGSGRPTPSAGRGGTAEATQKVSPSTGRSR